MPRKKQILIILILKRMEKDGLIKAKWKMIENKRFRRYYRLYELGYAGLEKEYTQCPAWKQPMIFS